MSATEQTLCPSFCLGDKNSDLLILLAGFPDNETSSWGAANLDELAKKHRLICLCLPGYDKPTTDGAIRSWGWDLPEVSDIIHNTIEKLLEDEVQDKYTLLCHDWGAFFGMVHQNKHPERIKKIVLFDIGVVKKPPVLDALRIVFYQWWFAAAFVVSQLSPTGFFRWAGDLLMIVFKVFFSWNIIAPTNETVPRPIMETTSRMCYPYFYFWFGKSGYLRLGAKKMMRPKEPQCPVLFFYGTAKNVMFHGESFVEGLLARKDGSVVKPMENAGHWMLNTKENAAIVLQTLKEFL